MKILSIYNEPVILEEGDFIAVENVGRDKILYVKTKGNIYSSCRNIEEIDIQGRFEVNSMGSIEGRVISSDLKWVRYTRNQEWDKNLGKVL